MLRPDAVLDRARFVQVTDSVLEREEPALDVSGAPDLAEGEWVGLDYDLPSAAEASGLSQYELLTGLSGRLERRWS